MPLLKKEIRNNTLILTLSDPESRNAFSPPMAEEFHKALKESRFQSVLLKSEGPVFCSGGNLPFYKRLKNKDEGLAHNQRITEILDYLQSLPVPKICLVEGLCIGGGVELVAAFDKVFAAPHSLFGLWQRRVGLTFGWGGQERLSKKVSSKDLQNWLLEARTFSSYQAKSVGLVDQIYLSSNLMKEALKWIDNIEKRGSQSQRTILQNHNDQKSAFNSLWLGEEHKRALGKVKT